MSEGTTDIHGVIAVAREACRRLSLNKYECSLISNCVFAHTLVDGGNFLAGPHLLRSISHLKELGYLTEPDVHTQPPLDPKHFGKVVVIEQSHYNKLIADANATLGTHRSAAPEAP